MSSHSSHTASSGSSVNYGFPEEDLRVDGNDNPGYFPARLGQLFEGGRFCIVRKLGWGQYSSVWLARDKKERRFVALKILTCESTKALKATGSEQKSDELAMLSKIASADPTVRGFKHTLAFYESFGFKGPHGDHLCLATEVLGPSVDDIRKQNDNGDWRLSMALTKKVARHVLCGLEYLHDVCGIVHADIKHDNLLLRPTNAETIITHQLVNAPSASYDCGTEVIPPVIPIVSQGIPLTTDKSLSIAEIEVVLADVGHSHWQDRHFQELIQPSALRAPEIILGYPWNQSADIWNFGCLMTELLIGFWLFEFNAKGDQWDAEEDHLARMTEALEANFDHTFLDKCAHKAKFFNNDGTFSHFTAHAEPTWPLEKLLKKFASCNAEEAEVNAAAKFLRRCLQLKPEDRATARELLDDAWLENV